MSIRKSDKLKAKIFLETDAKIRWNTFGKNSIIDTSKRLNLKTPTE